jgi:dCTP diphosphatase
MKSDSSTQDLQKTVSDFAKARDWGPFHNPKNLAMALCSEAGELAALLRWVNCETSSSIATQDPMAGKIADELGDIGILLLQFCNQCNLDFAAVVKSKLAKVGAAYPADKSKGLPERP